MFHLKAEPERDSIRNGWTGSDDDRKEPYRGKL